MERLRWALGDPLQKVLGRGSIKEQGTLQAQVAMIIKQVQKDGDEALRKFSLEYDGVDLDTLRIDQDEIAMRADLLSSQEKASIRIAYDNIKQFHSQQSYKTYSVETMPGVTCERQVRPIEKVGLYVPGGSAPLFSSLLMQAIPAMVAGVPDIAVCHPFAGELSPSIAYVLTLCNISKLYRLGGAQAIAAFAVGTASVEPVDKIFGPGNHYVNEAKRQIALLERRKVSIDMYAGPSEVLILADHTARADYIAADLISQAEHGEDSWSHLITNQKDLIESVEEQLHIQLEHLPRKEIAEKALEKSRIIEVKSTEEMIVLTNHIAPEHLLLQLEKPDALLAHIFAAGSVFVGHDTPESVGDYASGSNHVLPTGGYARSTSGLTVESFQRTMSVQRLTPQGIESLAPHVARLARLEELDGHARAAEIRTQQSPDQNS